MVLRAMLECTEEKSLKNFRFKDFRIYRVLLRTVEISQSHEKGKFQMKTVTFHSSFFVYYAEGLTSSNLLATLPTRGVSLFLFVNTLHSWRVPSADKFG